jgi:hypothetical protein
MQIFAGALGIMLMTGSPAAAQSPRSVEPAVGIATLADAGQISHGPRDATASSPLPVSGNGAAGGEREVAETARRSTPERGDVAPVRSHGESPVSARQRTDVPKPSVSKAARSNRRAADAQAEVYRKAAERPAARRVVNEVDAILDEWMR